MEHLIGHKVSKSVKGKHAEKSDGRILQPPLVGIRILHGMESPPLISSVDRHKYIHTNNYNVQQIWGFSFANVLV